MFQSYNDMAVILTLMYNSVDTNIQGVQYESRKNHGYPAR